MNVDNIKKLSDCLNKYALIAVYLFGSEAKGTSGKLSDIDIAVLFNNKTDKSGRFDMRLRISSELSSIMNKTVEVVVLNDSPIQLSYEVIKHGNLILCNDRSAQIDFETETLSKYLDRRYYDKRHAELVLEKIASRGL